MLIAALAISLALSTTDFGSSRAAPKASDLKIAESRLAELARDFEVAVEEYDQVHARLARIRGDMAAAELLVGRLEGRIGTATDGAEALAQELYKGGTTGALEMVLSSDDLGEIQSRVAYLQSSQKAQTEVFETLAVDRSALEHSLAQLEKNRAAAVAAEARLSALRTRIEDKIAVQRNEIADLNAAIERAARRAEARAAAAREAAANRAPASAAAAPALSNPAPAPQPAISAAGAPNSQAQVAVQAALSKVGSPYQWAAAGPDSFDCSGLTMWAWAQAGVALPHSSASQYAATPRVSTSALQPGDLIFAGSPIHHVGLYIGNGQMVEAPYTGAFVRVVPAPRPDTVGAGRPGT